MKHLITLLTALTFIVSVNAQTNPPSRTRSTASFTQVDEYLSVIKRLGIPTSNSDTLNGLTSGPNSVKLIYNTALNKLRVYNPVTATWRDAIEPAISLIPMNEGNGIGHRLSTQNVAQFGNIGLGATDLSTRYTLPETVPFLHLIPYNSANTYGATGRFAFTTGGSNVSSGNQSSAFGLGNLATATNSFAIGQANQVGGAQAFVSGSSNTITTGAVGSFIGGGELNTISGQNSSISGSTYSMVTSNASAVLAGIRDTINSSIAALVMGSNNSSITGSNGSMILGVQRSQINVQGGSTNVLMGSNDSKVGTGYPVSPTPTVQRTYSNIIMGSNSSEIRDSISTSSIISSHNSSIKAGLSGNGGAWNSIIASYNSSITLKASSASTIAHNNVLLGVQNSHITELCHNSLLMGGSLLQSTNRNQVIIGVANVIDPWMSQFSPEKKTFIVANGSGTAPDGSDAVRSNAFHVTHGGDSWTQNTSYASKFQLNDLNTAPASATAAGVKGEIRVTDTHIYVCTATNTWVRAALSTW